MELYHRYKTHFILKMNKSGENYYYLTYRTSKPNQREHSDFLLTAKLQCGELTGRGTWYTGAPVAAASRKRTGNVPVCHLLTPRKLRLIVTFQNLPEPV